MTGLSYAPNGAHLAVGLASGEVQVFDIESNTCIFTLQPHHEVGISHPISLDGSSYSSVLLHSILQGHQHWRTQRMVNCWQLVTEMDRYRFGEVRHLY